MPTSGLGGRQQLYQKQEEAPGEQEWFSRARRKSGACQVELFF